MSVSVDVRSSRGSVFVRWCSISIVGRRIKLVPTVEIGAAMEISLDAVFAVRFAPEDTTDPPESLSRAVKLLSRGKSEKEEGATATKMLLVLCTSKVDDAKHASFLSWTLQFETTASAKLWKGHMCQALGVYPRRKPLVIVDATGTLGVSAGVSQWTRTVQPMLSLAQIDYELHEVKSLEEVETVAAKLQPGACDSFIFISQVNLIYYFLNGLYTRDDWDVVRQIPITPIAIDAAPHYLTAALSIATSRQAIYGFLFGRAIPIDAQLIKERSGLMRISIVGLRWGPEAGSHDKGATGRGLIGSAKAAMSKSPLAQKLFGTLKVTAGPQRGKVHYTLPQHSSPKPGSETPSPTAPSNLKQWKTFDHTSFAVVRGLLPCAITSPSAGTATPLESRYATGSISLRWVAETQSKGDQSALTEERIIEVQSYVVEPDDERDVIEVLDGESIVYSRVLVQHLPAQVLLVAPPWSK